MAPHRSNLKITFSLPHKSDKVFKLIEEDAAADGENYDGNVEVFEINYDQSSVSSRQLQPIVIFPPLEQQPIVVPIVPLSNQFPPPLPVVPQTVAPIVPQPPPAPPIVPQPQTALPIVPQPQTALQIVTQPAPQTVAPIVPQPAPSVVPQPRAVSTTTQAPKKPLTRSSSTTTTEKTLGNETVTGITEKVGNGVYRNTTNFLSITDTPPLLSQKQQISGKLNTECCISLTVGWLTIGIFMVLAILMIICCLCCMYYFQKKEKKKCDKTVKEYNENYQKNSKMPNFDSHFMPSGPVIMTPQAEMDQRMKNMKDNPHPITTDGRGISGVLNYLANNPIEHDVLHRPGRQDVVLSQIDYPAHVQPIPNYEMMAPEARENIMLQESPQIAERREPNGYGNHQMAAKNEKEKPQKYQKYESSKSISKKANKSIEKFKKKLFNRSKSERKPIPSSSPIKQQQQESERNGKEEASQNNPEKMATPSTPNK